MSPPINELCTSARSHCGGAGVSSMWRTTSMRSVGTHSCERDPSDDELHDVAKRCIHEAADRLAGAQSDLLGGKRELRG